ncbi:MAG: hypothetical protein D6707_06275, partial [Bacteroidetes bacterium]
YQQAINELYQHNDTHKSNIKDKGFQYLLVEDIIFYQRPLKSQKGNIGGCQYEKRSYWKTVYNPETKEEKKEFVKDVPIRATSKSNPVFQEFRLWHWLKNLKIYQKEKEVNGKLKVDVDVTDELLPDEDAWVELFNYLTTKKEIDLAGFLKYFSDKKLIPKRKKEGFTYRWNYPEDKKYPMYETRNGILSRLKKVEGLENPDKFLTPEIEKHLWHIIYSISDAGEFEKALGKFASKYGLNKESFVQNFKKIPPYKSDYASYSEKAIKKLLPLMRMGKYWSKENIHPQTLERIEKIINGEVDENIQNRTREKAIHLNNINDFKGLPLWLASYVVYDRHSESGDIQRWESPDDIDKYLSEFKQHSLRNPIVEKVVLETLRTVRDIWKKYGEGKEGFFDEIHVE